MFLCFLLIFSINNRRSSQNSNPNESYLISDQELNLHRTRLKSSEDVERIIPSSSSAVAVERNEEAIVYPPALESSATEGQENQPPSSLSGGVPPALPPRPANLAIPYQRAYRPQQQQIQAVSSSSLQQQPVYHPPHIANR